MKKNLKRYLLCLNLFLTLKIMLKNYADTDTYMTGSASKEINNFMETLDLSHPFLMNYQYAIYQYFMSTLFKDKLLLLLWLSVGRGKTLLSITCGIAGLESNMFKRIIILSPKAVQNEFEKNLKFYCYLLTKNNIKQQELYDKYIQKIIMVAYNSWKSYEEFQNIGNINNSLFIIDEAHLFMKSVIKVNLLPDEMDSDGNTGNAKKIYDDIKKSTGYKVLALTGTPSAKTPYETVPLFNLAYKKNIFNENYEEFTKKYINTDTHQMKCVQELVTKLDGLVSYVPPVNGVKASDLHIVNVEMSYNQYKQYLIDYEKELNEQGFSNKKNVYGMMFGSVSSFHTKTFQDSIYYNSEATNDNRDIGNIYIDKEHCPKLIKMYNDSKIVNGLCVFYFRFTNMYGIKSMQKLLELQGYSLASSQQDNLGFKSKRYVVFSGDYIPKTLNMWKNEFNKSRNIRGDYIKYMLISPAGQVGISLKNVRYLGIGSVEFNYSAIRQILGRVNRLNSHAALPLEERTIENNIYITTKNNKYYNENKKDVETLCDRTSVGIEDVCPTIENILYHDSLEDDKINEDYKNKVLMRASITEKLYNKF